MPEKSYAQIMREAVVAVLVCPIDFRHIQGILY